MELLVILCEKQEKDFLENQAANQNISLSDFCLNKILQDQEHAI